MSTQGHALPESILDTIDVDEVEPGDAVDALPSFDDEVVDDVLPAATEAAPAEPTGGEQGAEESTDGNVNEQ
jgi:hypothetical protein